MRWGVMLALAAASSSWRKPMRATGRFFVCLRPLSQSRISIGNISIIQHATDPTEAAGLSKIRLLALGLLFSLIAATAWVGVADFFDASIYTSSDVQKHLGAAPLEVVPVLKDRYRTGPWKSYRRSDAFRKTAWTLANSLPDGV